MLTTNLIISKVNFIALVRVKANYKLIGEAEAPSRITEAFWKGKWGWLDVGCKFRCIPTPWNNPQHICTVSFDHPEWSLSDHQTSTSMMSICTQSCPLATLVIISIRCVSSNKPLLQHLMICVQSLQTWKSNRGTVFPNVTSYWPMARCGDGGQVWPGQLAAILSVLRGSPVGYRDWRYLSPDFRRDRAGHKFSVYQEDW